MTQVFLSHSTLDVEFVDQLAADLRDAGIVVWKAPDSILPGEEWIKAIQRGLATSSHFVLVKSPNAADSEWVNFEFEAALRQYHKKKMQIIPVLYQPCDEPLFWEGFQHVDLREQYMRSLLELIRRLSHERPKNPPIPAPPNSTMINLNIAGDVSGVLNVAGRDVLHSGPDAGRPEAPPIDSTRAPEIAPREKKKPPKKFSTKPTPEAQPPSVAKAAPPDVLETFKITPGYDHNQPFLMPIEDIFEVKGRGVVVTGRIERGVAKQGMSVEIVGLRGTRNTVISGVDTFGAKLAQVEAGNQVGILLNGLQRDDVEIGMVVAAPGSITPHTRFACQVYVLHVTEGGRDKPFQHGYTPQFYFRTAAIGGEITLPKSVKIAPGHNGLIDVKLDKPVALEKGTKFVIRDDGRNVGIGTVKYIFK